MKEIIIQSIPYLTTENHAIQIVLDHYKVGNINALMSIKYAHTGKIVLIYILYIYTPLSQTEICKLLKIGKRQISYIIQEAKRTENKSINNAINKIIKIL